MSNHIHIASSQRKISISLSSVRKVVSFLSSYFKINLDELGIYFVGEKKISVLHEHFFGDPSPTDCITFPYENTGKSIIGEIFICPQVAQEYILNTNEDLYEEITLYVIHGFLHLLGYTDIIPKEKLKMRQQEKKILKLLIKKALIITPNKT